MRAYRGASPEDDEMIVEDPLVFLNTPESVLVTRDFARRHGLQGGDQIALLGPLGRLSLTVQGALKPEGVVRVLGSNLGVMDIFAAQQVLGKVGKFDRISITLKEGVSLDSAAALLANALPHGVTVKRPEERRVELESLLAALQWTLSAVSVFALFIGLFMVYNTMSTAVVRRQREPGALRAIGARRREVVALLFCEASLFGVVGSVVGWALGVWLAEFLVTPEAEAAEFQAMVDLGQASLTKAGASEMLLAAAGVAAAVFAGWRPARRASRIAVLEALRPSVLEGSGPGVRLAP